MPYPTCCVTGDEITRGWYWPNSGEYMKNEEDAQRKCRKYLDELVMEWFESDHDHPEIDARITADTLTNDDILTMAYECEWMYWSEFDYEEEDDA